MICSIVIISENLKLVKQFIVNLINVQFNIERQ